MKNKAKCIIAALLAVMILAACGAPGGGMAGGTAAPGGGVAGGTAAPAAATGDEVTVINFSHRWPNDPRNSMYYEIVALFESRNPGFRVEMNYVINDVYKERIRVMLSGGTLPDIFTSWSYTFAGNIARSGQVQTLDHLLVEYPILAETLIPTQLVGFTFNDRLYGLPFSMDGKIFYYNRDIFRQHGKQVPTTLDELFELLAAFAELGYDPVISAGLQNAWAVSHWQGTIVQRLIDPAILDIDTDMARGVFTDQAYIDAMNIFMRLSNYMGAAVAALPHENARNAFIAGDVPLFYAQFSESRFIEGTVTAAVVEGADFDFGFFNFPAIEGGLGDQGGLTGAPEGYMMSVGAVEGTSDFLRFLVSQEVGEMKIVQAGILSPIYGAISPYNANSTMLAAVDVIGGALTVPWLDNMFEASIADAFMRGGQSMIIGDMTAEQLMEGVQAAAAIIRDEHG